jgi:hypothetical protein
VEDLAVLIGHHRALLRRRRRESAVRASIIETRTGAIPPRFERVTGSSLPKCMRTSCAPGGERTRVTLARQPRGAAAGSPPSRSSRPRRGDGRRGSGRSPCERRRRPRGARQDSRAARPTVGAATPAGAGIRGSPPRPLGASTTAPNAAQHAATRLRAVGRAASVDSWHAHHAHGGGVYRRTRGGPTAAHGLGPKRRGPCQLAETGCVICASVGGGHTECR